MSELILQTSGKAYGGWKSINVHLGMEEASSTFDIGLTEIWPEQKTEREIISGEECTIKIAGETAITGYTDAVSVSYDNSSHSINVRGRDKTADLIDCSAIYKTGEWRNVKLEQIAKDLCAPFGIKVIVETDTGDKFKVWVTEPGETVFACIDRAAKHRGVLLTTDGTGTLIITRASKKSLGITLERGINILSANAQVTADQRFSQYIVKGQAAGDDSTNGEAVTSQKASSKDAGVKRYRPLIIISEDQGDISSFKKRAEFEANIRSGRARTASITVQGFTHAKGLWRPNQLVTVRDPWLKLNRDMLISEVDLSLDDSGSRSVLNLALPEAYSLLPVPEKKQGSFL